MTDIKSLTFPELQAFVLDSGFPKFRAAQISGWLQKSVTDFDEMRNLPESIRSYLKTSCYISVANIEKKFVSRYDKTVKYLFSFCDGECVESVLMSYRHGWSICISTQVGCKMGCTFCATGKSGYSRDLTASEMLAQIEAAQRDQNIRVSNVVLMGMGEPLDNYENVLRFLRIVSDEKGLNIGMRHITLSTLGAPQVAYKEAFTKAVDVECKYAKQSGGRGQYGHCKVKFEPMEANCDHFEFDPKANILLNSYGALQG